MPYIVNCDHHPARIYGACHLPGYVFPSVSSPAFGVRYRSTLLIVNTEQAWGTSTSPLAVGTLIGTPTSGAIFKPVDEAYFTHVPIRGRSEGGGCGPKEWF